MEVPKHPLPILALSFAARSRASSVGTVQRSWRRPKHGGFANRIAEDWMSLLILAVTSSMAITRSAHRATGIR